MKELLLLLCHYPYSEKYRSQSRLLSEIKDWPYFTKLINSHGIIALAAYNIKAAKLEGFVPKNEMSFLENGYRKSMIQELWLTERWKEVNTILESAGIRHILLKGMALEHTVYGAAGLRQMNDNDIYISPEDSIKAWYLLQEKGFAQEPFKSPLFRKITFNIGRHLPALYKDGYTLEIHDNLFEDENSEVNKTDDLFSDAREIKIGETRALILSDKWQLRHLTDHFKHHMSGGECQLRLYTDLLMLSRESQIQFPDNFIEEPIQSGKPEFRKAAYKRNIRSIPARYRMRFIIGDTFPTLIWMTKRYRCGKAEAVLRYLPRIGKLWWLV
ncbi:MAG: nucleotidyltransferase family protein [Bacteroidales bacterium]|nr:nucleotidyltransferase family protein [Bacteroidales bacterium]